MNETACLRLIITSEILRVFVSLFMLAVVMALHRDVTKKMEELQSALSKFEARITR